MSAADLSEARRLLGMGMHLVELIPYTKQPAGDDWNHRRAVEINPHATGYGLVLAPNKLCSVDPDNVDQARQGLAALGFDLERIMEAGVRTRSTRPGSGGRSTFAAEGDLCWLKFSSPAGTAIEFRAESPNLQDCVPGVVYRDKAGRLCRQEYANCRRLDDAPPIPDELLAWWERCSRDVDFLREQQRRFFEAVGVAPHLAISTGKGSKLAFEAPGIRTDYNARHDVESLLDRHGYTYDRRTQRWAPPSASGAAGVRPIPGKAGLWRSDHASDPLHGTFDAWTAHVVLDHAGDIEAALAAATAEGLGQAPEPPEDDRFPPIDVIAGTGATVAPPSKELPPDEPLFRSADTLRATSHVMPAPIIEGVLLRGASLLHGPAKKGKSWLLLQMLLAIDEGANFLGRPTSRFDALYVGAEDTAARFKSRLERMFAQGTLKFMDREQLQRFARVLRTSLGDEPVSVDKAIEHLWRLAGRPTVVAIDTQEVFEVILGITHGKPGDSITKRDYQATSIYDAVALRLGIAVVLVGHWGEIKSIEKATANPHECLNTTKARLAGVTTSITLGPLPNQEPGESTGQMQLSIRSRDLPGGDQFLWVSQDRDTGVYTCLGAVRDVLVSEAQARLFTVLLDTRKERGPETWLTASDLADELDCSTQAVKQMVARVRRAAKAKGRKVVYQSLELESKPNKGYRLK